MADDILGLADDAIKRYSRQLILHGFGARGQQKLAKARVAVIGAGGLGSPAALYLAAAGVGTIGIVDDDRVELSNLQRQILHRTRDLGRAKTESAQETLQALNPDVRVVSHAARLSQRNAETVLAGYHLVLEGSDNFATKYLANDTCVRLGVPLVLGAVQQYIGQVSVFWPPRGPCYRCLMPEVPSDVGRSCQENGILGATAGVIGTIQAMEAVKLILGIGEPLMGRLLVFDGLGMEFTEARFERRPNCPACGSKPE